MTLIRKQKKLSQAELGKRSGINGDIVGKYERNEMKPSIETAKNIADALGVTLDYLLGDSNNAVLDKEFLKRQEDIEKMEETDKQALFRMIDCMLTKNKFKDFFQKNVAAL